MLGHGNEPAHETSKQRPKTAASQIRVLFLSNRSYSAGSAAEEGPDPNLLSNGLTALGMEVSGRPLTRFPFNPLARKGTFWAGFDVLRAIQVVLFERRVDVVVSVGESNLAALLILARLTRFRAAIVLREVSGRGWAKRDRVVDFVVPKVDRLLLLTSHQMQWVPANFRLRAPADLVGFAVDETFFRPVICPEGGYVLAVGDDGGRDYTTLIEACRTLPCRLKLRTDSTVAIPPDMRGRVDIIGRLSHVALRDVYAAASVVVVPLQAVDHPSGITSLFEAMAMGRAVVATEGGSTRGIVEDGRDGCLVPPADPGALRQTLARLLTDPSERERLGRNARAAVVGKFSYAAYINRFADSLKSVVTNRRVRSAAPATTPPLPQSVPARAG